MNEALWRRKGQGKEEGSDVDFEGGPGDVLVAPSDYDDVIASFSYDVVDLVVVAA